MDKVEYLLKHQPIVWDKNQPEDYEKVRTTLKRIGRRFIETTDTNGIYTFHVEDGIPEEILKGVTEEVRLYQRL